MVGVEHNTFGIHVKPTNWTHMCGTTPIFHGISISIYQNQMASNEIRAEKKSYRQHVFIDF